MNEATKNETADAVAGQVQRPVRRVVCAAIKLDDGTIVCGARHFDNVMRAAIKRMNYELKTGAARAEQGFIDQFGEFMDRRTAMRIAKANGQIFRECGGKSELLYSEHLY